MTDNRKKYLNLDDIDKVYEKIEVLYKELKQLKKRLYTREQHDLKEKDEEEKLCYHRPKEKYILTFD